MPNTQQNPTLETVLELRPEDQPGLTVTDNQGVDATTGDVIDAINENAALSQPSATTKPVATVPTATDKPKWHDEPLSNFQLNPDGTVKMHPRTGKPVAGRGKGGRRRKAKPGEKLAGGGVAPGVPGTNGKPNPTTPGAGAAIIDPTIAKDDQVNRNTPADGDDLDAAEVFTELADDIADGVGGDKARMTKAEKNTIQKGMGSMTRGRKVFGPLLFVAGAAAWGLRLWITHSKEARRDNEPRDDHRKHEDGQINPGKASGDAVERGW